MNWRVKAVIQNAIAMLPESLSLEAYFRMQRLFGNLRRPDVLKKLAAGVETCSLLRSIGFDPAEKAFFEIGTGRSVMMPIAFWLSGAKSTVTVDINCYLKDELLVEMLHSLAAQKNAVLDLFGQDIDNDRLHSLVELCRMRSVERKALFDLTGITYLAPADASNTSLPSDSIDVHTSYTVLEHIPSESLQAILSEGNRITKPQGVFIHRIDYSDHFSHTDSRISSINFLKYSEDVWLRYAGNRFMYMNRLRHEDYVRLFYEAGHKTICVQTELDHHALELLLSGGIRLNAAFENKTPESLAIRNGWFISEGPDKQAYITPSVEVDWSPIGDKGRFD